MTGQAAIDTLVVPTRARGTDALVTVRSFLDRAARHGCAFDVCIADDSVGHEPRGLEPLRRRLGGRTRRLRHLDRAAKLHLVEALVAAGCDRDALVFALFDPLRVGDTTGANRNALQLATIGERVLSIDDDIAPRVFQPPHAASDPAVVRTDPTEFWFFTAPEEAEALSAPNVDPIAVAAAGLELPVPVGLPKVAASWVGTVGDPGSPNGLYMVLQDGPSRARLSTSDEHYAECWASRRIMRTVVRPTIGFGHGWTPAVVAYNHAQLLPPFFPVLRGEGIVFGAVVLAGGAWTLARMPAALEHRLATPLAFDKRHMLALASSLAVAGVVQIGLMRERIASAAIPPALGLLEVGRRLADLARTPESLRDFLGHAVEMRARGLTTTLQAALDRHGRRPTAWARDVDDVLAGIARLRAGAGEFVPYDLADRERPLELLRELLRRYAALLECWGTIVTAARTLDRDAWTPTLG